MRSLRASIAMTMLLSFSVSFTIMFARRNASERPPPESVISRPDVERRASTVPIPAPAPAPMIALASALPPKPSEEPAAGVVPNEAASALSQDPVIPVRVVFKFRERLKKFEGRIENTSGDPLVIDVRVLDVRTHMNSQAEVTVSGYVATSFGLDDGLDMQAGNQVTLRADQFRDQVLEIQ